MFVNIKLMDIPKKWKNYILFQNTILDCKETIVKPSFTMLRWTIWQTWKFSLFTSIQNINTLFIKHVRYSLYTFAWKTSYDKEISISINTRKMYYTSSYWRNIHNNLHPLSAHRQFPISNVQTSISLTESCDWTIRITCFKQDIRLVAPKTFDFKCLKSCFSNTRILFVYRAVMPNCDRFGMIWK